MNYTRQHIIFCRYEFKIIKLTEAKKNTEYIGWINIIIVTYLNRKNLTLELPEIYETTVWLHL